MLSRSPTAYDDKIYSADWRAFVDPEMPETIAPTAILLDRHLGTPFASRCPIVSTMSARRSCHHAAATGG
jgi:hypothetical protein